MTLPEDKVPDQSPGRASYRFGSQEEKRNPRDKLSTGEGWVTGGAGDSYSLPQSYGREAIRKGADRKAVGWHPTMG